MDVEDYIKKFKTGKKSNYILFDRAVKKYKLAGDPCIECRDAIIRSYKYTGIRLSDIFIFDPGFLQFLIKSDKVDDELKSIAQEVVSNQSTGMDSIDVKLALE